MLLMIFLLIDAAGEFVHLCAVYNSVVLLTGATFPCAAILYLHHSLTVIMLRFCVIIHIVVRVISLLAAFRFMLLAICPNNGSVQVLLSR